MFGYRHRRGSTQPRVVLFSSRVLLAIQAGLTAKPEIPVKRDPETRLDVIAQVSFKRANGLLGLCGNPGIVLVLGEELGVGGIEPGPAVGVEHPVSPAPRQP